MKKSRIAINHLFQLILGFFVIYVTASCHFDSRGLSVNKESFTNCTTWISNCDKKNEVLDVSITGNPGFPQIKNYKPIPNLWEDKSITYELYYDSNLSISNIELPEIKGSLFVQTSYQDSRNDSEDFLKITPLNEIENFYIAYDSRVKDACKPDWLNKNYTLILNPDKKLYIPYQITFGNTGLLEIWRKNVVPKKNESVPIPGNINKIPPLPVCIGINPMMYVIIVKPKVTIDCKNRVDLSRQGFEGCFESLAKAEVGAQEFCKKAPLVWPPPLQCRDTFCDSVFTGCPVGGTIYGSLKIDPRSFLYNSEIEFDPLKYKSSADITLWLPGKRQDFSNQGVTGNLHFEYQYQTNNLKLNSITLKLTPLNTDAGRFEDINITLWKFSNAACKDKMMPFHQPCTLYDIAQGDLLIGLSAKLNGKGLLFAGTNQNVIHMTIDHPTRTFNFKGPLHTTVNINDKDTPLDISVDLTGHFVNFAPKAFGRESTRSVECGLSRTGNKMTSGNKDPVILDSAGSFEIYDTLPTNPANYEWYEDFGLVTEKLWGKGSKYTIAPYNLGYGVHSFTLVVKDKNGLVDTDTFEVEVRDTIPPEFTMEPNDIPIPLSPDEKEPVKVDIGQASAYDNCSENVMVSNDAPKDMLFPLGDTTVTWTADDGKGNINTKWQKVSVRPFTNSVGDFIWSGSLHLMEITNKSMNAIEECKANPKCMIDFEPLISALERFIVRLKETSVADDKELLRRQVINKLEPALIDLKEAHDLSKRSNEGENMGRMEVRNSVLNKLRDARNSMAEVSNISRNLK